MENLLKQARQSAGVSRESIRDAMPSIQSSSMKLRLTAIHLRLNVVCDELDRLISEIPPSKDNPHTILGQGDYEKRLS